VQSEAGRPNWNNSPGEIEKTFTPARSYDLPRYFHGNLPQYHLPELRGNRGMLGKNYGFDSINTLPLKDLLISDMAPVKRKKGRHPSRTVG
jgi:hypothetical protein